MPQSYVPVGLENVVCVSDNWDLCLYITDHNCAHSEDVFLTCGGTDFYALLLPQELN